LAAFADEQGGDDGDASPLILGDGTPESCTQATLNQALAVVGASGGGTIGFDCGTDPATIGVDDVIAMVPNVAIGGQLAVGILLPNNTTIDGQGTVTFNLLRSRLFVDRDSSAVLKRLSFTGGRIFSAVYNVGRLTVDKDSFSNHGGGAITNSGTLRVKDSTFNHNSAVFGGGIYNSGLATIAKSTFSDNLATARGGGIRNTGTLIVDDCLFSGNISGRSGGSAITSGVFFLNEPGVGGANTLTVKNTTISGNVRGAGIANLFGSTAEIKNSEISGNTANGRLVFGGGILNLGSLALSNSKVTGNTALLGGGGVINAGTMTINDSEVSGNQVPPLSSCCASGSGDGGGIYNEGGMLTISDSVITGNVSPNVGGGIYDCCGATLTLKNTSVEDNTPDNVFPPLAAPVAAASVGPAAPTLDPLDPESWSLF